MTTDVVLARAGMACADPGHDERFKGLTGTAAADWQVGPLGPGEQATFDLTVPAAFVLAMA